MGKFRGGKKRRMAGCGKKLVAKRNWMRLLIACENLVQGSAEKLHRIKRNKEASFSVSPKDNHLDVLQRGFWWADTPEGFDYWFYLFKKLRDFYFDEEVSNG